jgi:hypothetical protein
MDLDNDDELHRYRWHGTHVAGSCFGTDTYASLNNDAHTSTAGANHGDSNTANGHVHHNHHAEEFSDLGPYQQATAHFSLGVAAGARAMEDGLLNNSDIIINIECNTSLSEPNACSPESPICVENIAAEKQLTGSDINNHHLQHAQQNSSKENTSGPSNSKGRIILKPGKKLRLKSSLSFDLSSTSFIGIVG